MFPLVVCEGEAFDNGLGLPCLGAGQIAAVVRLRFSRQRPHGPFHYGDVGRFDGAAEFGWRR